MIGFKTVRFTKLLGKNVNLGEFTKGIFDKCRFGPLMVVNMGISFTASKGEVIQYMYCPKSNASFTERFGQRSEAIEWAKSLNDLEDPIEIMAKSFLFGDFGEFWQESGWVGRTPVALHLWIQKWYHFFYQYGTNMISINELFWYQPE